MISKTLGSRYRDDDQLAPIFKAFKDLACFNASDAEQATEKYKKVRHEKMAAWANRLSDSTNRFARAAFAGLVKQDSGLLQNQQALLAILHPAAFDKSTSDARNKDVKALVKNLRSVTKQLTAAGAVTRVESSVFDLVSTVSCADLIRRKHASAADTPISNWSTEDMRFSLTMREFLDSYANWIEEFKIPEVISYVKFGEELSGDNLAATAVRKKKHRNKSNEVGSFCVYLTAVFKRQYGQYLPTVVANLANAVFEPVPEISADNVKAMTPGLEKRPTSKSRQPQNREVK